MQKVNNKLLFTISMAYPPCILENSENYPKFKSQVHNLRSYSL